MRLYKITTGFSSREDVYEKISYGIRAIIDDLEEMAKNKSDLSADYTVIENGKLVSYVFGTEKGLEVLKVIIAISSQTVELRDVTEQILLKGIDIPETDEFYPIYERFIFDHLSIDNVLDNISKKGINKMTALEKRILSASK